MSRYMSNSTKTVSIWSQHFFWTRVHLSFVGYDYNEMASLATSSESKTPDSIFNQEESEAILQLRAILTPDYKDDEWFSAYLDDTTL